MTQNSAMKGMLKTLLNSGNIGISDIVSVLFEDMEERTLKSIPIPEPFPRKNRGDWAIWLPKKYSTDGERHQITGKTAEEAITNFKASIVIPEGGITVEKYMQYVLLTYIYKNVDNTTYDRYEGAFISHVKGKEFGKMQLCDVTGDYLTKWIKQFTSEKYQKQTAAHLSVVIKETFLRAEQNGLITKNISEYMTISYRNCNSGTQFKEVFTVEELAKIESVIENAWEGTLIRKVEKKRKPQKRLYHYSPIFMLMSCTGMRLGEVVGLKKENIDKNNMLIYIDSQCVEEYERDEDGKKLGKIRKITEPKTQSSIRSIPLSESALYWIDELERRQKELKIITEFILANRNGKRPTKSNIYDMWEKILEDADVEYRPPHKLRKTFITLAIEGGMEVADVAKIVGHKDVTTTLNTYYKPVIDREKQNKNAKIIDGVFNKKPKNKNMRFG
ncbi:MAG: site-specific integrase [Clostridiales bacterium]|nr:site-specific integrase [Clostridiales bacterium]